MRARRTSEGKLLVPTRLGRYDLFGEIASGGMATVYLGRMVGRAGFERTIAVKVLHGHLATNPEFVAMFLDEARLSARIRHPNVVDVYDVDAFDGELFIVMEYVEGAALNWILRLAHDRGREVPMGFVLRVVHDMLLGLHAAHELSDTHGQTLDLVHRDVSPQNILVGADGIARVSDFGIAKAAGRIASTHGHGTVKGKLRYLSPEQLKRLPSIDRRTDVFAAGIVLWECLTGEPLFAGDTEGATMALLLNGDIQAPSEIAKAVPPEVDRVCLKALERDRAERFPTAMAFADAIEEAAGARMFRAREVGAFVSEIARDGIDRARAAMRTAQVIGLPDPNLAPPSSSDPQQMELDFQVPQQRELDGVARKPADEGRSKRRLLTFAGIVAMILGGGGLTAWLMAKSGPPPQGRSDAQATAVGSAALPSATAPESLPTPATTTGTASAPPSTAPAPPSSSSAPSPSSSDGLPRKRPPRKTPFMPSEP
jgi:serine/threonine protein kinase